MELIDTHVHLLYPEKFTYAWGVAVPALNRPFPLAHYRAAASDPPRDMRVKSLMFLEADVPAAQQLAEVDFISRVAAKDRGELPIAAIIAGAWPESADFATQIEQLAGNGRVRGVRRVLHTMPDEFSSTLTFSENLRRLPELGLTFDLCLRPPLLPTVTALVARCPATQFVLDHAGVPDIAGGQLDPWRENLQKLAEQPNVVCKFSGLASCCDPAQPMTPQVRPYFDHCLKCFTPQRLMWGSDWPLCDLTFDLPGWLRTTSELLCELSEDEQTAIGMGTAKRIYRLV
ncbi:MAG: amidohydrolase family protein [Opitutaceae bacterium]